MSPFEIVQAVASVVTAGGIFLAFWQLVLTKRIAASQCEDQLAAEYREIIRRLPVKQCALGGVF